MRKLSLEQKINKRRKQRYLRKDKLDNCLERREYVDMTINEKINTKNSMGSMKLQKLRTKVFVYNLYSSI